MNWNKGYSSKYYMTIVDATTWRDVDRINIISGKISRTESGLRESADVKCRNFDPDGEKWVRLYIDATQSGEIAHTPIFTGLAVSPQTDIDGVITEHPLQVYSVLKPAEDIRLLKGWYAPAEINGAEMVRMLLSVTPAPIRIDGISPTLTKAIVAEQNENNLTMADKILQVINWRIRIEGDGTIVLCPKATEASAIFDAAENDSIEPKLTRKRDWFNCPNVYTASQGDLVAAARDDDPNSPLSTVTRGREVHDGDDSPSLNSNEGIAEYARRKLKEAQAVGISYQYKRRYRPDLTVGDKVRLHYPKQNMDGVFLIKSQSIEIGYSAQTDEEVVGG